MLKAKRSLRGLSARERVQKSDNHIRQLTDNSNFPASSTWLPPYQAAHDELNAAILDCAVQLSAYRAAVIRVRQATARWDKEHGLLVSRVEVESGGDPVKLQSGGFQLHDKRSVAHRLTAPQSLSATFGDRPGCVDLAWDPLPGARSYIVQFCTDIGKGNWQQALISTKSSCIVKGLVSGANYWFRVAGLNSAGEGVFSDPALKMSP